MYCGKTPENRILMYEWLHSHQDAIVVGHVVRRLYSTGGMAGGVMANINSAIFEIVNRNIVLFGALDMLTPTSTC